MFEIYFMMYSCVLFNLKVFAGSPQQSIYEKFHQTDFKVKFEHIDVDHYNKSMVKEFKIVTFKYNRTCTAFNGTLKLKVDLNGDMEIVIQTYKFASNEYRLFPLRSQVTYCLALSSNLVGISEFTKCGNFSGCPLKKDKPMHVCNWHPDESRYPPFVPTGRYMVDIQLLYHSAEVAVVKSYAEIYRPIPIPD